LILTETVLLFLINAELLIKKLEPALLAIEVMICLQILQIWLNVSYLPIILLLLILDAKYGIGINKFVLNALKDGISNQQNVSSFRLIVNQVIQLLDSA
jgi:hypothetical protein